MREVFEQPGHADRLDALARRFVAEADATGAPETEEGDRNEVLRELGYLAPGAVSAAEGRAARAALLADAAVSREFAPLLHRAGAHGLAGAADAAGETALQERLSELLALEVPEANGAARRPGRGERSLWSRVVKARILRLDGFRYAPPGGHPADPWGAADDAGLAILARDVIGRTGGARGGVPADPVAAMRGVRRPLPDIHDDRWIALSGDAEGLLGALRTNPDWRDRWFVARSAGQTQLSPIHPGRLTIGPGGAFARLSMFDFLRGRRNRRALDPRAQVDMTGNVLGLRLIKIRLWQLGYYSGRLTDATSYRFEELAIFEEVRRTVGRAAGSPRDLFLERFDARLIGINPHWLDRALLAPATPRADVAALPPGALRVVVEEWGGAVEAARGASGLRLLLRSGWDGMQATAAGPVRMFRSVGRMLKQAGVAVAQGLRAAGTVLARMTAPLRQALLAPVASFRTLGGWLGRAREALRHLLFGVPFGAAADAGPRPPPDPPRAVAVARAALDRDLAILVLGAADAHVAAKTGLRDRHRGLQDALDVVMRVGVLAVLLLRRLSPPFAQARMIGLAVDLARAVGVALRARHAAL